MLLNDVLGDNESSSAINTELQKNNLNSSYDIFNQYLKSGLDIHYMDPTEIDQSIISLNIDEWCTNDEIKKETQECKESIEEKTIFQVENLNESLTNHASFTMNILEKLTSTIFNNNNNSSNINQQQQNSELIQQLSLIKTLQSEKLFLSDRCIKLAHELIDLKTQLFCIEKNKNKTEKLLDKTVELNNELKEKVNEYNTKQSSLISFNNDNNDNNNNTSSTITTDPNTNNATNHTNATSNNNTNTNNIHKEEILELRKQITLLEKQLAESETAKAKVEMDLTERFARPMQQVQTDAQIADIKKAMDDLRIQSKQRVSYLFLEVS